MVLPPGAEAGPDLMLTLGHCPDSLTQVGVRVGLGQGRGGEVQAAGEVRSQQRKWQFVNSFPCHLFICGARIVCWGL